MGKEDGGKVEGGQMPPDMRRKFEVPDKKRKEALKIQAYPDDALPRVQVPKAVEKREGETQEREEKQKASKLQKVRQVPSLEEQAIVLCEASEVKDAVPVSPSPSVSSLTEGDVESPAQFPLPRLAPLRPLQVRAHLLVRVPRPG